MLYYRAKRDAYDYFTKNGVVLNELLTKREREKRVPYIQDCVFEPVHISQRNIYMSFGVRFECGHSVVLEGK